MVHEIRLKDVVEKIADDAGQALEEAFGGEGSESTVASLLESMAANGINLVRHQADGRVDCALDMNVYMCVRAWSILSLRCFCAAVAFLFFFF